MRLSPLLSAILLLAPLHAVWAADAGDGLDHAFGQGGVVRLDAGPAETETTRAVRLADGGIATASVAVDGFNRDLVITRFAADGSIDVTFGNDGVCTWPVYFGDVQILGLRADPDGAIIVLSVSSFEGLQVSRATASGAPDSSFGAEGKQVLAMHGTVAALEDDGGFVIAAGYLMEGGWVTRMYRLNPDLTHDPTNDSDPAIPFYPTCIAVLPGGSIALGGWSGDAGMSAVRLTNDLATDPDFSDDGIAEGTGVCSSVTGSSDGTVFLGGIGSAGEARVIRLHPDGTRDADFIGTPAGDGPGAIERIVQAGDRLHAVSTGNGSGFHIWSLDRDHGTPLGSGAGPATLHPERFAETEDPDHRTPTCRATSLEPDGDGLLITGTVSDGRPTFGFVARLDIHGHPDPGFSADGGASLAYGGFFLGEGELACTADGRLIVSIMAYGIPLNDPFLEPDLWQAVICLDRDGRPDHAFGDRGIRVMRPPAGAPHARPYRSARNLCLEADGGILTAGSQGTSGMEIPTCFISRLGAAGREREEVEPPRFAAHLMLDAQGRPIVASGGYDSPYVVQRLRNDLTLDPSFGVGGRILLPPANLGSLAIGGNGALTALGETDIGYRILRYHANGTPDHGFGDDGVVDAGIAAFNVKAVLLAESGGATLLASGSEDGMRASRRLASGELDPAFGSGGTVDLGGPASYGFVAAAHPRGSVLATRLPDGTSRLVQLDRQGHPDPAFGPAGRVIAGNSYVSNIAISPGGNRAYLLGSDRGGARFREISAVTLTHGSPMTPPDEEAPPADSTDDSCGTGSGTACLLGALLACLALARRRA